MSELHCPFDGMGASMIEYIKGLQQSICSGLERFEPTARFQRDSWQRDGGGGGITAVIDGGEVFEKGGVNISSVHGKLEKAEEQQLFRQLIKQNDHGDFDVEGATFFATGLSLVIHPLNPNVPTVHMNYRYFEIQNETDSLWWFGGGTDLTPYILDEADATLFHQSLKDACDGFDPSYYSTFKRLCDDYFYIKHRKEYRGIGGIFFDHLHKRPKEHYFELAKSCGNAFLPTYSAIVEKQHKKAYTQADLDWQYLRRGHYAEFNLVYDKGTIFGLKTSGRVESILMSLPKHCSWHYCPEIPENQKDFQKILTHPKNWL